MKDVKFLAIFVGLIVDICGSLLTGVVIGVGLTVFYAAQGVPLKQITAQLSSEQLNNSFLMLFTSIGLGEISVLAGGFITGWMAKNHAVKNALITGSISAALGLAFAGFYPIWYNILCVLLTPSIAALGGYIAQLLFGNRQSPQIPE